MVEPLYKTNIGITQVEVMPLEGNSYSLELKKPGEAKLVYLVPRNVLEGIADLPLGDKGQVIAKTPQEFQETLRNMGITPLNLQSICWNAANEQAAIEFLSQS